MMAEIASRGPIACDMAVNQAFEDYKGGVFYDKTGLKDINHVISLVGYGTDANGVKYWIGRNSWGEAWGEEGFFRIIRGVNNLAIESDCAWAVPDSAEPQIHTTTDAERNDPRNDYTNGPYPQMSGDFLEETPRYGWVKNSFKNGEKVHSPRPQDYVQDSDVPDSFFWGDKDGVNYLSWSKNQHIPEYCGSCWSEGTTSSLADRFNILDKGTKQHGISAQAVINCQEGGSCNGGDPSGVYDWAYTHGLEPASCMNYEAANHNEAQDISGSCKDLYVCRDCSPPPPKEGESGLDGCRAITDYQRYYASEFGSVRGEMNMKKEIMERGPIGCGIQATQKLEALTDCSVYSEYMFYPEINHEIAVVGWGKEDDGTAFWWVRNSWGTYFGCNGYFKLEMKENYDMGVTMDCVWAVPSYTPAQQSA